MSEPVRVYAAIANITLEMSKVGIAKERRNQAQQYQFRGIDDVYAALSPLLAKHKLCVLPRVTQRDVVERANARGNALFYTTLTVDFDFVSAEDGSKHTVTTVGEAMDSGDKSCNKAMSAAYKYACFQAFCIPTEGDNDADATTHTVAAQSSAPRHDNVLEAARAAALEGTDSLRAFWKTLSAGARDQLRDHTDNLKAAAQAADANTAAEATQ